MDTVTPASAPWLFLYVFGYSSWSLAIPPCLWLFLRVFELGMMSPQWEMGFLESILTDLSFPFFGPFFLCCC